jgi:hypothetical protein
MDWSVFGYEQVTLTWQLLGLYISNLSDNLNKTTKKTGSLK